MDKFINLATAISYAERCIKLHVVILGDNGLFWVVSFRKGQELVNAGYELAN